MLGRNRQTRYRHQAEQTGGLEHDSLAACIGTGDDHVEMTLIEGDVYFDRAKDIANREVLAKEREALEKLDMNKAPGTGGTPPRIPTERRLADRDEADRGNNNR